MSRSRRRASSDDSLELLLDPICNMFGAIMFVLLIAALLAMGKAGAVASEVVQQHQLETEQRTSLEESVEALREQLNSIPRPVVQEDVQVASEDLKRAMAEAARRRALVTDMERVAATAGSDFAALEQQLEALEQDNAELAEELKAAKRSKSRESRTPRERAINKILYTVVIWGGQLYAVCERSRGGGNGGPCEDLRRWHPAHVVRSACSTPVFQCGPSVNIVRVVRLNRGHGVPIGDGSQLGSHPDMREIFARLDPRMDIIDFRVAPDSFAEFAEAKRIFLERGFDFTVWPAVESFPDFEDSWLSGTPTGM